MASQLKIDIIAGIDKLSASLKEVESKFGALGDKLKNVGGTLSVAVTAPLVAIGAVATNEFATVEKGLREINSLFGLTGAEAEKNFGMLTKVAEEASKELGILQSDVVPAMYNAISAGVPKENIFDFIKVAGKAAIGGVTDLNTSVDGLTSIINAFGLQMSDAESVADSMFAAVQGGKTTFSELSASIFNIAPAAAAAGVSMQEVNAAIAALTAGGTPTAVATTQIRAALTGLQRPSEELDAIFQKLGFQTAQIAIESEGLGFALTAVKNASNGSNGQLQTLLGSTEAVAAANVLAGTGAAKFSAELDRQANAAGAAAQAAAEIDKSFGREMERTKVAANNLAISIGTTLAPALSAINSVIEKVIGYFSNLSPTTQKVVIVVAALAASIGPLLLGIGSIIAIIPTLTAGLAAVKFALMAVSGPVGIAIAAVAALAVAIIANWDTIKSSVLKLGTIFLEFGVKILESIRPFADFLNMGSLVDEGIKKLNATLEANKTATNSQSQSLEKTSQSAQKAADKIDKVAASTNNLTEAQIAAIKKAKYDKWLEEFAQIEIEQEFQANLNAKSLNTEDLYDYFKANNPFADTAIDIPMKLDFDPAELDVADQAIVASAEKVAAAFNESKNKFKNAAESWKQEANAAIQGMAVDSIAGFAGAIGESLAGGEGAFANFGTALLGNLGSIMQQLGKAAISIGFTMEAIKKAFTNPFTAIAAGIALIAVGKFISTKVSGMTSGGGGGGGKGGTKIAGGQGGGLTAFAAGGIVSGPTAALVGEYPGARNNPEVIAPLNKLQNMMGGNVTFTISGDSLVGTLNRANKTRARKF